MERDPLTDQIIGAAIEVHRELGPGLLESSYEICLCEELRLRSLRYRRQVDLPIRYKGVTLSAGYRIDLIVEETVTIEIKACEEILPVHKAQLLTYLRLTKLKLGLLLNFHTALLKEGIERMIL